MTHSFEDSPDYAAKLDREDPIASYRKKFFFPQHEGKDAIYFCGNSLGLQPRSVSDYIQTELDDWKNFGVEGHFNGTNPWFHYHKFFSEKEARLVGALPEEVVVMNSLTVNLHLMMVSFYRPDRVRKKIIIEGGAFPSDQYAMESQARFHGFNPDEVIIELTPRENEHTLRIEDIIFQIEEAGDELALVMLGGVNYYTGQLFEMEKITRAAHKVGAKAGFDLAHAAGNVLLNLHDWNVDFAVWCTYKYLNSGPGGVSGVFVHDKYANDKTLPRFAGWWGHNEKRRFLMEKGFDPEYGAAGWQLSNAQILPMAAHKASLDLFDEVGMQALRKKSDLLTAYLEFLIRKAENVAGEGNFTIITPSDKNQRGAQLSMFVKKQGKALFDYLSSKGVVADWREPNVIRVAPVPMYNSFEDVYRFYKILIEFYKK